jgi:hypothetical protein
LDLHQHCEQLRLEQGMMARCILVRKFRYGARSTDMLALAERLC